MWTIETFAGFTSNNHMNIFYWIKGYIFGGKKFIKQTSRIKLGPVKKDSFKNKAKSRKVETL